MIAFFFFFYDEETDTAVPVSVDDEDIENMEELEFFFDDKVRKIWHKQEEAWYFSIVDVCQVLADLKDYQHARNYWKVLKLRLKDEGDQLVTNCNQLKIPSPKDGKLYKTDCVNLAQLLRIIQSIPSKKAEPFKRWLAQVGKERLDETADPELAIERMIRMYRAKGYPEKWIEQRLRSIDARKALTDEWYRSGVRESRQYAALTDILTKAWAGKTVREYKQYKSLHKENLRDNMTPEELVFNQLAEISTTAISKTKNPNGYKESKEIAHEGGVIAGNARKELEKQIGHSVISPLNAQFPDLLDKPD